MTVDHTPVETAWKIHAAVTDWTGKVDAKAGFVLAIETAVLGGIVALSGEERRLSRMTGAVNNGLYYVGAGLIVIAVVFAILTVRPQLRGADIIRAEFPQNFVYFGHLQHWDHANLAQRMPIMDILPMLTKQVVVMSEIAYRKHRYLQYSMNCLVLGVLLVGLAAALND